MVANSSSRKRALCLEQIASAKNPGRLLLASLWMYHWLLIGNPLARARSFYQICTTPPPGPDSCRIFSPYFVLMCFSLPGEYRKLLA